MGPRRSATLGFALVTLAGCRCVGPTQQVSQRPLRVQLEEIDFGQVWVGASASKSLDIQNPSRVDAPLELQVTAPFEVSGPASIVAGESVVLQVEFRPTDEGPITGSLGVNGQHSVHLTGSGRAPPRCRSASPCEETNFDFTRGECVTSIRPDGAACTSSVACFASAACSAGECIGRASNCADANPCTLDACSNSGCVHLEGFEKCSESTNPCLAAVCRTDAGCGFEELEDGTPCGGRTCTNADVCIAGQCVNRPAPQTQACVEVVLGEPSSCGIVDGVGANARVWAPGGIAVDSTGTVWLASEGAVRSISPAGVVRTISGGEGKRSSDWTDGVGSRATFNGPEGVAIDEFGELFVADRRTIRVVSRSGVVRTLAGNAALPERQLDGIGSSAHFLRLHEILYSRGAAYVVDASGYQQNSVRRISRLGEVSTVWNSLAGAPIWGLTMHGSDLFALNSQGLVRLLPDSGTALLSPTCAQAWSLAATSTSFGCAWGGSDAGLLRVTPGGVVLERTPLGIADTLRLGSGANDLYALSRGIGCGVFRIDVDGGARAIAGTRSVDRKPWDDVAAVASNGAQTFFSTLGQGTFELTPAGPVLFSPVATRRLLFISGRLLAADGFPLLDLTADPDGGATVAIAGGTIAAWSGATLASADSLTSVALRWLDGGSLFVGTTSGNDDGPVGVGKLRALTDIVGDGRDGFFVAQAARIRHLSPDGTLTTIAGTSADAGFVDGPALAVQVQPYSLAFDRTALYFAEGRRLRKLENGQVTTLATLADPPASGLGSQRLAVEDGGTILMSVTGGLIRIRP